MYEGADREIEQGFAIQKSGKDVCLVATGYMLHTALTVAKELENAGISVGIIDLIDLSYFNQGMFLEAIKPYGSVVSMEEGFKGRGGVDAMLFNLFANQEFCPKFLNIGVEGGYRFELGSRSELHEQVGIGSQAVIEKIKLFLS